MHPKVVFSGVGKTADEVDYALANGIHAFNCESEGELALIDAIAARRGVEAGFAIRVNPDVDAATHPYISTGLNEHKFGIALAEAAAVYERARRFRNLKAEGVSCHIGSQILDPTPIYEAVDKVLRLASELRAAGHPIRRLDLGGGLGVAYREGDRAPEIAGFVRAMEERLRASGLRIEVEPGRSIVGPAGALLTRVLVSQAQRRQGIRHCGRRHERSVAALALSRASRDSAGAQEPDAAGDRRRGGPGLRNRRFSGARPRNGECDARRLSGGDDRRRLWIRAVFQLQFAPARGGGVSGRRSSSA